MPFLAPLVGLIGTALAGGTITAFSAIFAGVSVGLGFVQSNKKQKQPERQAQVAQMSLGEGPREAIFGKAMTGGRLMQVWNDGTKNEFETLVIKLADHECNDYEGFLIGEDYYGAEANGAHSSFTVGGTPHLYIYFQSGAAGQTVPSAITSVSGSEWPSTAKMVGCAHVIVRYKFNEKVWPGGRPQFKWYMGGLKCYDPRKDSTVAGGSGSHRWDDQSTYEYTQNPILLAYNYRRGVWNNGELMVGRGLSAYRCPPEAVIADANICDELVPQLSGPDLVRYDCGRVVRADEPFIDVMTSFAEACGGMLVQRSGRLEIAAGAPQSSVFSFTDDDLVPGEPRDFLGWLKEDERCNTVVPRYLEPTQFWNSTSAPIRRDNADVTADGRPFEKIIELDSVFVNSQAQRLAEIERRKARLERTAAVTLPPRACNVEAGDVVTLTSNRYLGGDAVKWWVMRDDDMPSCRKRLTLREYADAIYDWDAATDEIAPGEVAPATSAPGALALASVTATAVSVSSSTGAIPAIKLEWTGTTDPAIKRIIINVRKAGTTNISPVVISDPDLIAGGLVYVTEGVAPGASMEIRARPDSDDFSRTCTWSSWLAVTATDITAGSAGAAPWSGVTGKPTPIGAVTNSTEIDNASVLVGGRNLVKQSQWGDASFSGGATAVATPSFGYAGWGFDLTPGAGGYGIRMTGTIALPVSTQMSVGVRAKVTAGSAGQALYVDIVDAGTFATLASLPFALIGTSETIVKWEGLSSAAAGMGACIIRVYAPPASGVTIQVTDLMVELGNKCSTYVLAQEELALANQAGRVIGQYVVGVDTTVSGTGWITLKSWAEANILAGAINFDYSDIQQHVSVGSGAGLLTFNWRITDGTNTLVSGTGTFDISSTTPGDLVITGFDVPDQFNALVLTGSVTFYLQIQRTGGPTSVTKIRGILTGAWRP